MGVAAGLVWQLDIESNCDCSWVGMVVSGQWVLVAWPVLTQLMGLQALP